MEEGGTRREGRKEQADRGGQECKIDREMRVVREEGTYIDEEKRGGIGKTWVCREGGRDI